MKVVLKGEISKNDISSLVDLDVIFDVSYRPGFTIVEASGDDEDIFVNYLRERYVEGHLFADLTVGEAYYGRLVDVGKYGFGVFCDINSQKDVLISLNSLRELFGGRQSTREYVYSKGLIDGLCVKIDLIRVERGTEKVWGTINREWSDKYLKDGNIMVSKTSKEQILNILNNSSFKNSVEIMDLCSDSFVLVCRGGVDPPGIVHLVGNRLRMARLGIVGEL
ncbi:MAG TPA: DUF2110 family protein [Candidatus Methanofastidiosa archaeon]|nr:DUF2110 family protein [Candidatus Methanofastidiosa archaeon]